MRSSSPPPPYGGFQRPDLGSSGPDDGRPDFAALLTPKTVVSLAVWLLMFGLGAGLSGIIFFIVYQAQVNNLRSELLESQEELRKTLEERIETAPTAGESASMNVSEVAPDPLKEMVQSVALAIVGVSGRDSAGQVTTGSGFVVNSTDDGTWVLTSQRLVAGVTDVSQLSVRRKNSQLAGEVYETDPARDLALVIYHVPAERSLRFSRAKEPKEGDQVWAIGNLRTEPYAAGLSAKLTSVSSSSLGLDIEVPPEYVGGPLLDADGRVLGILTSGPGGTPTATPAPGGAATPIDLACERVLRCPSSAPTSEAPAAGKTPAAAPPPAPPPPPESVPEEPLPPEDPNAVTQPPVSNPNTADVPIG